MVAGDDLANRPAITSEATREGEGGRIPGRWVYSHDIRVGDMVLPFGKERAAIREIAQHVGQSVGYNLTVRDLHSFAVGTAEGYWCITARSRRRRCRKRRGLLRILRRW